MYAILAASESPLGFLSEFGVEWQLLVSQGLSFAIVATALYYFVFRPVTQAAQKRQDEIKKGLDDAKKAAEELANAKKIADEKLNQAIAESSKILKEAREQAKASIDRAVQEANERSAEIRAKNEAQLESDRLRIKQELRSELADLVVKAAQQAVEDILTDEQRARLAENAAKKIDL
ncbi:MAG: F0F1 ATP synthase subunit B [Verrucomicrobiaceae bacterium]|nr:F0F1 ATP synthase subunit B [Verrucomicrobiaceae bacterium]